MLRGKVLLERSLSLCLLDVSAGHTRAVAAVLAGGIFVRSSPDSRHAISRTDGTIMPSGTFYALADFIGRLVPKRGTVHLELLNATVDGLKRIATVQEENPSVTMDATVTAGVWIYYQGRRRWLLNPAQNYIRLETPPGHDALKPDIALCLKPAIKTGAVENTGKKEFRQWRVQSAALPLVWKFFEGLERPADDELYVAGDGAHPRTFPGSIRELALQIFNREDRICPGVAKASKPVKPHKLGPDDRIEYDHILPFANGGASSIRNIQILCAACNRLKGGTAA